MRTWLLTAPRWAICVLYGTAWAIYIGALQSFSGLSWWAIAVLGVGSGMLYGFLAGRKAHTAQAAVRATMSRLTDAEVRAAQRATGHVTRSTPVPVDPRIRTAAAWLNHRRLVAAREQRVITFVLLAFLGVLLTTMAVVVTAWAWLPLPLGAAVAGYHAVLPGRLERRQAELWGARLRPGAPTW